MEIARHVLAELLDRDVIAPPERDPVDLMAEPASAHFHHEKTSGQRNSTSIP
jgi:hypothetical protein